MSYNHNDSDNVKNIQLEGLFLSAVYTNTFYVTTPCLRSLCVNLITIRPIKTFPAFNGTHVSQCLYQMGSYSIVNFINTLATSILWMWSTNSLPHLRKLSLIPDIELFFLCLHFLYFFCTSVSCQTYKKYDSTWYLSLMQ